MPASAPRTDRKPRDSACLPARSRTAFSELPVLANDDSSFTIVATHTRLVRVVAASRGMPSARHSRCHPHDLDRADPVAKHTQPGADRPRERTVGKRPSSASSDHWKRLLRRPPREPVALDPDAFVEELNRRLRADGSWREDTRFVLALDASGSMIGTTWEGPEAMKPVIARIVKSVIGEFDSGQPFLFDR